jgi:hypothetical protein
MVDQEALQAQIAEIPGVQDLLPIEEFINLAVEEIMDTDEDITEAIIETYSRDQEEDVEEEGGEESEEPPVQLSAAIQALETLRRFEQAREDYSQSIKALDGLGRELLMLKLKKKSQKTLDSFLVRR